MLLHRYFRSCHEQNTHVVLYMPELFCICKCTAKKTSTYPHSDQIKNQKRSAWCNKDNIYQTTSSKQGNYHTLSEKHKSSSISSYESWK